MGCFLLWALVYTIPSGSRIQHILNEDAVAGGWVIHKNVSDGADQLAVLNDRRAGHADVK